MFFRFKAYHIVIKTIVEGLSTLNLADERLRARWAKRVNKGDSFAVCFFSWPSQAVKL
jgi:hypothetical protein